MKKGLIFLFCCIFMAASLNAQEKVKETPSKEELIHAPTDKEISEYYTKVELFMLDLQYISPEQKQELLDKAKQQSAPKDTLSFRFEYYLPMNYIENQFCFLKPIPSTLHTCFDVEKKSSHGEIQ
ncbi:MAG: hypothetical protein AB8B69_22560 [Chitinophagales bacterium]